MNKNPLCTTLRNMLRPSATTAAALTMAACGLALSTGCGGAEMDSEEELYFDEVEQALNSDASTCGGATADKAFDVVFSSFTSTNNYTGRNGCGGAYFADVTNYRKNNLGEFNIIAWGDSVPTTQAACEASKLEIYVFDVTTATPTFVANKARFGTWSPAVTFPPGAMCGDQPCIGSPARCSAPQSNIDHTGIVAGDFNLSQNRKYKFAVRARDISNAAAPVTKKIKFGRAPVVRIL